MHVLLGILITALLIAAAFWVALSMVRLERRLAEHEQQATQRLLEPRKPGERSVRSETSTALS
jgi:uncharacterized membrane protein YciS (DUF1049 family)